MANLAKDLNLISCSNSISGNFHNVINSSVSNLMFLDSIWFTYNTEETSNFIKDLNNKKDLFLYILNNQSFHFNKEYREEILSKLEKNLNQNEYFLYTKKLFKMILSENNPFYYCMESKFKDSINLIFNSDFKLETVNNSSNIEKNSNICTNNKNYETNKLEVNNNCNYNYKNSKNNNQNLLNSKKIFIVEKHKRKIFKVNKITDSFTSKHKYKRRKSKIITMCIHYDSKYYARGMCLKCYQKFYFGQNQ